MSMRPTNSVRRVFGVDYETFCAKVKQAAEFDALPFTVEMRYIPTLTLEDLNATCHFFQQDTGYDLTGNFYYCEECGKMHLFLTADYISREIDSEYLQ